MDYQYYRNDRRSRRMETLSLVMGIIALSTMCFVYPTLICGALGIVFALLSRGGEIHMGSRAKLGLILSSVSLGIIILMFAYTLIIANVYYGGLENMMREMYQMMGIDYDALMQNYK
ncbi:MAG: hypothetical protein PUA75_10850 [Clostridiales bacterium]|nr:hypothetical protein [Clostridiales bacterium]